METSKISVQGKGSVHIVPDVTRLQVIIDRWFIDYKKAYEQAKVMCTLKQKPDTFIQTQKHHPCRHRR